MRRSRSIVTFVPTFRDTSCPIYKLFMELNIELVYQELLFIDMIVVFRKSDRLAYEQQLNRSSKILCLGFKDEDYPVLKLTDGGYFSDEWIGVGFGIGVFFVQNGYLMFSKENKWVTKVESWLTFSDTFQPDLNIDDFILLQLDMYKALILKAHKATSVIQLRNDFEVIYSQYINIVTKKCNVAGVNISAMLFAIQGLKGNKNAIVHG